MNQTKSLDSNSACDHSLIEKFLRSNQYAIEDADLVRHLDDCESCRERMEEMAADEALRRDASKFLKPDQYDQAETMACSAATVAGSSTEQPPAIQDALDALTPSENPHHLGRMGNYEVTGVVGIGAMGVVLKAVDPSLDRVVALKMMAPRLANNEIARKRFLREAKAAAAVLHPNVIPIHGVSSDSRIPYLVMSYIRGGSLQKRIKPGEPIALVETLRIGSQIAAGLDAAHQKGLVHRDIKPENILLEEGVERVTITDFGLARAVDDNTVTQQGTIAGTPMYMSPEQARGELVDQQSDLFSFGSLLYTLCTGQQPYQDDTSYAVMRRIIDEEPTPVRELNPQVPEWFERIVNRLMTKDKSKRFQSAAEVESLLDACLSHVQQPMSIPLPEIPGDPMPQLARDGWFGRIRSQAWVLILVVVLGIGGVAGTFALLQSQGQTGPAMVGSGSSCSGDGWYYSSGSIYIDKGEPAVLFGLREDSARKREYCYLFLFRHRLGELEDPTEKGSRFSVQGDLSFDGRKAEMDNSVMIAGTSIKMMLSETVDGGGLTSSKLTIEGVPVDTDDGRLILVDLTGTKPIWKQVDAELPAVLHDPHALSDDTDLVVKTAKQITRVLSKQNVLVRAFLDGEVKLVNEKRAKPVAARIELNDVTKRLLKDLEAKVRQKPCPWGDNEAVQANYYRGQLRLAIKDMLCERLAESGMDEDESSVQRLNEIAGLARKFLQIAQANESSYQLQRDVIAKCWPLLLKNPKVELSNIIVKLSEPPRGVRTNDQLAAAGKPTEPLAWDVQAVHALALARSGDTKLALRENGLLRTKLTVNVENSRSPDARANFLGNSRSQRSLLRQAYLQDALIHSIAGDAVSSFDSSTAAGQVTLGEKVNDEDQQAIQRLIQAIANQPAGE